MSPEKKTSAETRTGAYNTKPQQPIVSEEALRYQAHYTQNTRRKKKHGEEKKQIGSRLKLAIENFNRNILYKIFRAFLNNPSPKARIRISDIKSIFIIPVGEAIGDMMVTTAIYRTIKRRNPECRIGTFVSHRNETLLRCDDDLNKQYHFTNRFDFQHYSEVFRARRDGYEIVLNMNVQVSEFGIIANIISPKGIKIASGHPRREKYRILFNHISLFDKYTMYAAQHGLKLLEEVIDFGDPLKQWEARPAPAICSTNRIDTKLRVATILQEVGATWFLFFNTQAQHPFKEWGMENARSFAKQFVQGHPDAAILFTASPLRYKEVEAAVDNFGLDRCKFFRTSFDLQELMVLAEQARMIVTPDTSIVQFGTAAKKPMVVLWANKHHLPVEWIPFLTPSRLLAPSVEGEPTSTIPVTEVYQAVRSLLDGTCTTTQTGFNMENTDVAFQAYTETSPISEVVHSSDLVRVFLPGAGKSTPIDKLSFREGLDQNQ